MSVQPPVPASPPQASAYSRAQRRTTLRDQRIPGSRSQGADEASFEAGERGKACYKPFWAPERSGTQVQKLTSCPGPGWTHMMRVHWCLELSGYVRQSGNRPGDSSRIVRETNPCCERLGRRICGQPTGTQVRLDELRPEPSGTLMQDTNSTRIRHKSRRHFGPKNSRPGRNRDVVVSRTLLQPGKTRKKEITPHVAQT